LYLKRLDVAGFKSFAARTTFEFGDGMTAIVGPNGSGKSNVADALRWVLGEQSGRLMRARKLEDIIYAGSGNRARSEKVEVTMTLDNSDRWLPIDVGEVSIARRGYRSGESDYVINGKKVRLRELQTLFMKAAASQSSYAIIGQGLVENILNLRADERRLLIEEAADIQRYRLKIEEAEGRLAATHENVERVRLLIKEIAPRVSQLERQARRAVEHGRLSQELKQALEVYYEQRWSAAQEALIVARAGYDQSQADVTQTRIALETCKREMADVSAQLEEHREAIASVSAERDRLSEQVRDSERRAAVAKERRSILEARSRELEDESSGVEAERVRLAKVVASHDDDRSKLEEQVGEAREVVEARQAELAAQDHEMREAHGHVADAQARAKRLEVAAAEHTARIRKLAEAARNVEREAAKLETRRRSTVNQMAEQLRVLQSLRTQESQLVAEVARTAGRRQVLEAEVGAVRGNLARLEADQNARLAKLEAMTARLDVLTDAQKQLQANDEGEAVSIEGAVATVFEIIRVPKGMEDAIAAALGDQLEAHIFDRHPQAMAAIQLLAQQRGARAIALPLDALRQVYPLNLMKEKGVLGVAAKLVKYPPKYEKLINVLLGRTIVVQDASVGVRLMRRGLGNVVTMDGIVFHQGGSISGGLPQASRPFVLGYERDIEALPKEMERVRRSLEIAEREAEVLRANVREKDSALAALSRDADEALDKRLHLQDSLAQRQQTLAQLRGELRGLMGSRAGLREQQRGFQVEAERLEEERAGMLFQAQEAIDAAGHMDRATAMVREQRKALTEGASEAADALAQVDGRYRSLSVEREAAEAALSRLAAQGAAKAEQLERITTETGALSRAVEMDEVEMAGAQSQLDSLLRAGLPGEEGAHHLEARGRDLHAQVLSCQNRMFDAERQALASEAEVRRWQTEVDNLRAHIEEDGLTLTPEGDVRQTQAPQAPIPLWLAADGPEQGAGGLRPMSGGAAVDPGVLGKEIDRLRTQIRSLGAVNVEAREDYESLRERLDFLTGQTADLEKAEDSLRHAIRELTGLLHKRFDSTFAQVARAFEQYFKAFFGGGHGKLRLSDPKHPSESGVEIEAQPPGKRTQSLAQLSGGEKALTAVSLLFSLLHVNPSPFCVLDEVDAMLDEANVGRFVSALRELSRKTQFIVITHNRRTIEVADNIYGISMAPDGASRVLSMRLGDIGASAAARSN